MTTSVPRSASDPGWHWPLIQSVFVLSGACALAYEVLWGRWLAAVLGSSATAACVVLASYMGGQAAGAALFGRLSARLARPLWAYVAVEVAIGASALVFPFLAELAVGLPPALRVTVAVGILVTPTVLLGGTVPLVLRWSEQVGLPAGGTLGRLYGLNTVGAAAGTLVAGFVLIPNLGLSTTNLLAAAGNGMIALLVLPLALRARPSTGPVPAEPGRAAPVRPAPALSLYVAAFLSGCVSLGIEVIFIRLLRITLASTTYVFTLVIATFVLGIGIGGLLAARRPERSDVVVDLAKAQIALVGMLLVDWLLAPYAQVLASAFRGGFEATLVQTALTCAVLLLPATILMGFLFPLLGRLFMDRGERGQEVGFLYMLNTLGAVAGAVGATIVLIPVLGASRGYLVLTTLALVSFGIYLRLAGERLSEQVRRAGLAMAVVLAGFLLVVPSWSPVFLGISGGYLSGERWNFEESVEYFAEGRSSNVLVARVPHGLSMVVDGKPVASTAAADRASQLLLGHLPALLASSPTSGLVVGMGTAMTLGALGAHELDQLDIVELEPRVLKAAALFSKENGNVLDRPELRVVFDDGYNFLHSGKSPYDVITSDPIHPFVRGGSTLYSADYFQRAAERLSESGVFAHWLPLPNMGDGDFKMIVRNFTGVFPYASLYWNGAEDGILVGRNVPWNVPAIDVEAYAKVAEALATTYIDNASELESLAFADRDTLVAWAGEGPRSTIDLPLLEFSAPKAMHVWTLDENLMTVLSWRQQWEPGTAAEYKTEVAGALRMVSELAPLEDPEVTRDFIAERLQCGASIKRCQLDLVTGTLRNVLFKQALVRAGVVLVGIESGRHAATREQVALARELLQYAAVLASDERPAERAAVDSVRRRLRKLRPS